ncbi:MAG: family 10 glycosylhydrolase [Rhodothermales bacterium]|nr:family 10 glycosylhydrolase [Rhodothermales bacterium]
MRLLTAFAFALALAGCSSAQLLQRPPVARPAPMAVSARAVWIGTATLFDSLGSPERLRAGLERSAAAGFTDVVVELKPYGGDVAYPSRVSTRLTTSGGFTPDPDWDVAADAVRTGRELGLRVHLALNVFAEGDHARRSGPVYGLRRTWQTAVLTPDGTVQTSTRLAPSDRTTDVAYTNPVRPDVRNHALALVSEVAGRYRPDGLLLDRLRFEGRTADFSPETRAAFEQWLHVPVTNWPSDILARTGTTFTPGPLYPKWLEWRALSLRSFVEATRQLVRGISPTTALGVLAPADYAAAAEAGLNWGAVAYDPQADYPWATPMYREKSLAAFVDVLVPELPVALPEADTLLLRTVAERVQGATRVVPSLQIRAFPTADAFEAALRATLRTSGAVLVSDYGELARRPAYWAALARAFAVEPASAVR